MQNNAYETTIAWLFEQFPSYQHIGAAAYKPNLENILALCNFLNHPEKELQFIHIAGTNGKGSVSSMLASILTETGYKTGLFTSPHLLDFRERIRVDGEMIPAIDVVSFCEMIRLHTWDISPSFFEITFAMSLWYFQQKKCTICVIETGLGGRLDATNIIQPLLSIITNISLEHTQYLGNTLAEIAFEKAGIIKKNTPVIIGESSVETAPIFNLMAAKMHASIVYCQHFPDIKKFKTPLLGEYQEANLKTVLCALDVLSTLGIQTKDESIVSGLQHLTQNTGFKGRMQIINNDPLTIIDVSHNLDGILKTLESVDGLNQGELHIIYGSSSDKNYAEIVSTFPKNAHVHFCTFSNQRSVTKSQFEQLNKLQERNCTIHNNIREAIQQVQSLASKKDTILVFGSFFLVADFF